MAAAAVPLLPRLAGTAAAAAPAAGTRAPGRQGTAASTAHRLPVAEIERIVRAKGSWLHDVFVIEIDRNDLPHVHKDGVPIKPAFQINGDLCFQQMGDGSVMLNADLAFTADELNPAIDMMARHDITWQAMHQHLWDLAPMVWFMHFRGHGTARRLAQACAAIISVTSTPLPQAPPAHPGTPLDVGRLSRIIGGTPSVGADGVVTVFVPQREQMHLAGIPISPYLNVFSPIAFQPLGGSRAVVVPDFGMQDYQVMPVARTMRGQGWQLDCLYNQETAEAPQLFFCHAFKVGDAYQLAREVRRGLDQTTVAGRP